MSVNHDYHFWTPQHHHHHHQQSLDSPDFNLNDRRVNDAAVDIDDNHQHQQMQYSLEVMFEKPLTPSDVGKLNRLVIPKQHAERHFPLNTSNGADSGGMLLSFEDEAGKFWRFRYSYWNSSQSYVLTKGWSRYVKEKRLDAGDVVVFQRHPSDPDRLFICWRRRNDPTQPMDVVPTAVAGGPTYPAHHHNHASYPAHQYQLANDPEASLAAAGVVNQSRTASFNGSTSSRTLRLFGVNMEYQFESDQSEPATPDGSSTSSPNGLQQQIAYSQQYYNHFYPQTNYYGMNNHMVQQDASHSQHRR